MNREPEPVNREPEPVTREPNREPRTVNLEPRFDIILLFPAVQFTLMTHVC
jgi:hypothetical protein